MKKIYKCNYKNSQILRQSCPILTEPTDDTCIHYQNDFSISTVSYGTGRTIRDIYQAQYPKVKDFLSKECVSGYTMVTHHAVDKQELFIYYTDAVLCYPEKKRQTIYLKNYVYHYFFNRDIYEISIEATERGNAQTIIVYNPTLDIRTPLSVYTWKQSYDAVR